jgi:hypothetical protein
VILIIGKTALLDKILPYKIVRLVYSIVNWTIRLSLLWISQQFFFFGTKSSFLRPTSDLEDRVSVYMSPTDRAPQSYPQEEIEFG